MCGMQSDLGLGRFNMLFDQYHTAYQLGHPILWMTVKWHLIKFFSSFRDAHLSLHKSTAFQDIPVGSMKKKYNETSFNEKLKATGNSCPHDLGLTLSLSHCTVSLDKITQ